MTIMSALAPSACFGAVMHERSSVVPNRFVYPLAFLRLPLSQLDSLSVPLLGIDRRNIFTFCSADHGPRNGDALLPWIRTLLSQHGLAACTGGEIVLQTMPRIFGYVFNPVSFWFCHDAEGRLRVVLAEVSNTFGERHNYLVHHPDVRPIEARDELSVRKVFHVSPFFPVRGEYRFRIEHQGPVHAVAIDYYEDGERLLATRVGGRAQALCARAMLRWLVRFPFMTLGVLARIHWQALRLWSKRVHFFRKPSLPLEETTR